MDEEISWIAHSTTQFESFQIEGQKSKLQRIDVIFNIVIHVII
jgi:hypothetical protein